MEIFMKVVGGIAIVAVCAILISITVSVISDALYKLNLNRDLMVERKTIHQMGQRMYNDASWFGENPDAQRLMELVGIAYMHHGAYRVEDLRENWRRGEAAEV